MFSILLWLKFLNVYVAWYLHPIFLQIYFQLTLKWQVYCCPVPLDADRDNTIKLGRISEHNVPTWFHHVKNMICISKFIFVLDIVNFRTKFE